MFFDKENSYYFNYESNYQENVMEIKLSFFLQNGNQFRLFIEKADHDGIKLNLEPHSRDKRELEIYQNKIKHCLKNKHLAFADDKNKTIVLTFEETGKLFKSFFPSQFGINPLQSINFEYSHDDQTTSSKFEKPLSDIFLAKLEQLFSNEQYSSYMATEAKFKQILEETANATIISSALPISTSLSSASDNTLGSDKKTNVVVNEEDSNSQKESPLITNRRKKVSTAITSEIIPAAQDSNVSNINIVPAEQTLNEHQTKETLKFKRISDDIRLGRIKFALGKACTKNWLDNPDSHIENSKYLDWLIKDIAKTQWRVKGFPFGGTGTTITYKNDDNQFITKYRVVPKHIADVCNIINHVGIKYDSEKATAKILAILQHESETNRANRLHATQEKYAEYANPDAEQFPAVKEHLKYRDILNWLKNDIAATPWKENIKYRFWGGGTQISFNYFDFIDHCNKSFAGLVPDHITKVILIMKDVGNNYSCKQAVEKIIKLFESVNNTDFVNHSKGIGRTEFTQNKYNEYLNVLKNKSDIHENFILLQDNNQPSELIV